jgi:hypothetical protein
VNPAVAAVAVAAVVAAVVAVVAVAVAVVGPLSRRSFYSRMTSDPRYPEHQELLRTSRKTSRCATRMASILAV